MLLPLPLNWRQSSSSADDLPAILIVFCAQNLSASNYLCAAISGGNVSDVFIQNSPILQCISHKQVESSERRGEEKWSEAIFLASNNNQNILIDCDAIFYGHFSRHNSPLMQFFTGGSI